MNKRCLELLEKQRIIVCCGAGGVGKTSTSAALAVAAARLGRRVLVITIDPAKRLGETLGLDQNPQDPVSIATAIQRKLGITGPGALSAWLLDPQLVADRVVRRFAHDETEARRLLENPMYKNISAMVAGMQEYTAVQAMYEYATSGDYDLLVLDTPPSRNALNFLQAPGRIGRFLEGRVFKLFLPARDSLVGRASSRLVQNVLSLAFGDESSCDLINFFSLFNNILERLGPNAQKVQELFRQPTTSFLVVTSPDQAAIDDACYLGQKSQNDLRLTLSGYIFNRSLLERADLPEPVPENPPAAVPPGLWAQMVKLAALEKSKISWQKSQYEKMRVQVKEPQFLLILPYISQGVNDINTLNLLTNSLID